MKSLGQVSIKTLKIRIFFTRINKYGPSTRLEGYKGIKIRDKKNNK